MKNVVSVSVILGSLLVACASAPAIPADTSNETSASPSSDPLVLAASKDTTASIGVTRWGAQYDGDTHTIHGYDDKGNLIVTVSHAVANPSAQESTVTDSVSGTLGSATLQVHMVTAPAASDGHLRLTTTVTKNTFTKGDVPSKVFDAALADQSGDGSSWAEASSVSTPTGSVSLGGQSAAIDTGVGIKTISLFGACVDVSLSCVESAGKTLYKGVKGAQACLQVAKDIPIISDCAEDGAAVGSVVEPGIGSIVGGAAGAIGCAVTTGAVGDAKDCVENTVDTVKDGEQTKKDCGCGS